MVKKPPTVQKNMPGKRGGGGNTLERRGMKVTRRKTKNVCATDT